MCSGRKNNIFKHFQRKNAAPTVRETLFPLSLEVALPPKLSIFLHFILFDHRFQPHPSAVHTLEITVYRIPVHGYTSYITLGIAIYLHPYTSPPSLVFVVYQKTTLPSTTSATRSSATRKHETCTTSGDNIRRHLP